MKTTLSLFFIASFLFACKKSEKLNPDAVRLVQIDLPGKDYTYHAFFDFDASGRIVKYTSSVNTQMPVISASVEYSGNSVIVHYATTNVTTFRDVKFLLNSNGKPVQRIEEERLDFAPTQTQRDFNTDTLSYVYDANGFLLRGTGHKHDSTWSNANGGSPSTQVDDYYYTIDYITENKNLKQVKTVSNYSSKVTNTLGTRTFNRSTEQEWVYSYSKHFSNQTDFSNELLLNEFNLGAPIAGYMLNKDYANMPDQYSSTRIEKDASGNVVSNEMYEAVFFQDQNLLGYINRFGTMIGLDVGAYKYTYKWY